MDAKQYLGRYLEMDYMQMENMVKSSPYYRFMKIFYIGYTFLTCTHFPVLLKARLLKFGTEFSLLS